MTHEDTVYKIKQEVTNPNHDTLLTITDHQSDIWLWWLRYDCDDWQVDMNMVADNSCSGAAEQPRWCNTASEMVLCLSFNWQV